MADVIGLSDVSSKDTGKGSKLKTGNLKRGHNMPKACVDKLMKAGKSRSEAEKQCYSGMKKTQKPGTSVKVEQNMVGWDRAAADNSKLPIKPKANRKY